MGDILRIEDIPQGEEIYLKKDIFGWRVVEPIHDTDGNFIFKNFFNPKGFVMLIILLLILGVGYLAFKEQITNYKAVMENPCPYCKDCQQYALDFVNKYSVTTNRPKDISNLNITILT